MTKGELISWLRKSAQNLARELPHIAIVADALRRFKKDIPRTNLKEALDLEYLNRIVDFFRMIEAISYYDGKRLNKLKSMKRFVRTIYNELTRQIDLCCA